MTKFSPEVVERVVRAIIASDELGDETSAVRMQARSIALAALEASGYAELAEALKDVEASIIDKSYFAALQAARLALAKAKLCPNSDKPIISE